MEESLEKQLLEILKQTKSLGIYIYEEKGVFTFVNDAFCRFIGYTKEELLSKIRLLDVIHPDERKEAEEIINRRMRGEFFVKEFKELKYITKDGLIKPAANFGYTVTLNGKPAGFVIVVDMMKQKAYEVFYKSLSVISEAISTSKTEHECLSRIPELLSRQMGFELVAIGTIDQKSKRYKPLWAAGRREYIDALHKAYISANPEEKEGRGTIGRAYREKRIIIANNVYNDEMMSPWRNIYKKLGIFSVCSIPLLKNGQVAYILSLYSKMPEIFSEEYSFLIKSIQHALSSVLTRIEAENWKELLIRAVDSGFEFVIIADENLRILFANENTERLLGFSPQELKGKPLSTISQAKEISIIQAYKDLQEESGVYRLATCRTKNNESKRVLLHISVVKKGSTYIIATGKDVTNNIELQKALEQAIKKDVITGLLNRYAFIEEIKRYIDRAKHKKLMGAVLVINPINFSNINKVYGFENGNKLLKQIARRLKKTLRNYDIIAKLESAKFAVLLKDIEREEDIFVVAIKVLESLSAPYKVNSDDVVISFNAGVGIYPNDSRMAEKLIEKAEIALSDAKQKGENSIGFYKERLRKEAEKRLSLKKEFIKGLKHKEFVMYFQPYFDTFSGNIAGAEVLVRWRKNSTVIPPMEFIPVLEETGDIKKLERYLIDELACKFERGQDLFRKLIDKNIKLSVNLSPSSLMDENFVDDLVIKSAQLSRHINIEITERLFLDNLTRAKDVLARLKENGFQIVIDDFGIGYSSLSYIAFLPIDYIKIDISFVRRITEDKRTEAVIKTITYLAGQMNFSTIAEGVENTDQLNKLRQIGCNMVQGFLFAKPMPESEFSDYLKTGKMVIEKSQDPV